MCGFIAAFTKDDFPPRAAKAALDRLYRRGPDAEGEYRDSGVFLGHRRLAIIDLDRRSSQPMTSGCGRYVIVFNGEIYNYRSLREELISEGVHLRTESDTEVILELFAKHGEKSVFKLNGMFAFVIWDSVARVAFAARDPYGIKPLYIGLMRNGLVLSSQVKAILATKQVSRDYNELGELGFWFLGSIPEPFTLYKSISSLEAGSAIFIQNQTITKKWLWCDIGDCWRVDSKEFKDNARSVQEHVRNSIVESVDRHMVSDVPVGVFLSGGIDSSAVAGLMKERGASDLIGVTLSYAEFRGRHEDETPVAAKVAKYYGIKHVVRTVGRKEFEDDLPNIIDAMDQPSVDGINSWYATKAVAELGLKVVVSGAGGDELFQGYEHFRTIPRLSHLAKNLSFFPGGKGLARIFGEVQARRTHKDRWRYLSRWMNTIEGLWWLRRSIRPPSDSNVKPLLAELGFPVDDADVVGMVRSMVGDVPHDPFLALGLIESKTYLRNQLLRDSDWASMYHSVELRTPLVDYHLLESLRPVLPEFSKYPGKSLLANAPILRVPSFVTERRKTGFGIPVNTWLNINSGMSGSEGMQKFILDKFIE